MSLDKLSKRICKILRHNLINEGLSCDKKGYVKIDDLISIISTPIDIDIIKNIVSNDTKQRFDLVIINDEFFIRANQGHSLEIGYLIDDSIAFTKIVEPYDFCFHGTHAKYIDSINVNGLSRCSRKHIHMVTELIRGKQLSGFKQVSNIIICIDMKRCIDDGMIFYISKNNVILTEGFAGIIPPMYFLSVESI